VIIRAAVPSDAASIRELLRAAFASDQEADLVDDLDCAGELLPSMVAEETRRIVGYLGFSRLWIAHGGQRLPGVSLAPLAVVADRRRRGIGAALVEAGHVQLRSRGESIVFVLGDPAYYGRFGYVPQTAAAFDCVYAGPHFQALELNDKAPRAGAIIYAAAFQRLQ
jgi:putative acetyltransferase